SRAPRCRNSKRASNRCSRRRVWQGVQRMSERAPADDSHVWGTSPDFVGPRHELREELLLDAFLAADPTGKRILNVGAGQGTFSNRLTDSGFEVTSTDLSTAAVEVLRERTAGSVVAADATRLPFPDQTFDGVILGEVIEHITDDVAA